MARQMKDSGIEWIGEIPEFWKRTKLLNLLRQSICDGPHETPILIEEGIPFISIDSLNSSEHIDFSKCKKYISENDYQRYYEKANLEEGDVLFTKAATIGKTAIVGKEKFMVWSPIAIIKVNEQIVCNKYVYHLLNCFELIKHISMLGSYNTQINVGMRELEQAMVPFPPLPEQRRIASFLDRKCAEIDAVIERTKATIEEYKKLKQAVIAEAVTKGVRGPRPMMDSRIEWLDSVPLDWTECRIKNVIFPQEKPITESDEVITCFRDGEVTLRKNRREDGFTISFTEHGYHGVDIGDLVIHGMDAFAGAIGCSDSRGKTTPVVHVCSTAGNNRYFMYFLRSMAYGDILMDLSNGVRIRSSDYRNFAKLGVFGIVVPPIDEQNEIVDFLDKRCVELDTLIAKKTALLTELETYKKSLIYEYVTGKRECPEAVEQATAAGEYPYFPAAVSTKKLRFAQAMMMAKVLDMHGKGMGRVKLEKMLYTIETSIGFDFDTDYVREAAGPLHESIYKCEGIISRQNHWYQLHQSQYGVSYTPTKDAGKYRAYYDKYFSSYNAEIERIINIFKPYSTDQAEIVATLFAAWNDAIIDRKSYTDEDIVDDVLNNWHDNKKRFPKDVWLRAMEQMRKNNLIPKGYGKHTVTKAAEM